MQYQLFLIGSYVNKRVTNPPTNLGRSHLKLSDSSSANLVVIKEKFYHAGSTLLQSSTKQINNSP